MEIYMRLSQLISFYLIYHITNKGCTGQFLRYKRDNEDTSYSINDTETLAHNDKNTTRNPFQTTTGMTVLNVKNKDNTDKTIKENNTTYTAKMTDVNTTAHEHLNSETNTITTVATTQVDDEKEVIKSKSTSDFSEQHTSTVKIDLSDKSLNVSNSTSNSDAFEPVVVNPIDKLPDKTNSYVTMKAHETVTTVSSTNLLDNVFTQDKAFVDDTSGTSSGLYPKQLEISKAPPIFSHMITTNAIVPKTVNKLMGRNPDNIPLLMKDASLVREPVNLEDQNTTQSPDYTPANKDIITTISVTVTTNQTVSSTETLFVQTSTEEASTENQTVSDVSSRNKISLTTSGGTTEKTTSQSMTTTSKKVQTTTADDRVSTVTDRAQTTVKKAKTTSHTKGGGSSNQSENTSKNDSTESVFGKYGLPMFIAVSVVALCLLIVVIYLCLRQRRRRKKVDITTEKNPPKLKMLEVRSASLTGQLKPVKALPQDDDLQTYSLDYEKHVQEKIEEHRKLVKNKRLNSSSSASDNAAPGGVTSFKIARRPSAESGSKSSSRKSRSGSQSGPTSPATPTSPEGKPLLPKEEEPIVFNFAKTPGEATAARRGSALDAAVGQRRNSGPPKKTPKPTKSNDDYYGPPV